jgi:hypothetical protein
MTKTWSDLTEVERTDVVNRISKGEDYEKVASLFGLRVTSLSRKIRYLRNTGGIDKYKVPIVESEEVLGERSVFIEDANEATLEWNAGRGPIRTLDELVETHQIDLDIWVQHGAVTHNTWTTPRKKQDAAGFEYFQNHQVKALFIRRNPIPIFPIIRPISISTSYKPPKKPKKRGISRSYIFADPQFGFVKDIKTAKLTPFHNRRVLDLHLQLIQLLQPDRVDILGDWLDMSEWTDKFMREPEYSWTTQPALIESGWWLAQIREIVPDASISLHQGNHDKRLDDAIKLHLPAAYGLKAIDQLDRPPALSLPNLLALHQLQVEWVSGYPNDRVYLNELLSVEHGERALSPGNTAKNVIRDTTETVVFGHIHRREMLSRSIPSKHGTYTITGFCPGCTCWTDGRVPGSRPKDQWQNGAAITEYEIGGDRHNLTPIFIDNGKCIYQKQLFEGRDRREEIRPNMDNWNI